jgi:hypothetical protein
MQALSFIKVPAALCAQRIDAYSDEGEVAKAAFHKQGKTFLRNLAKELPDLGDFSIRSNLGGIAVSGEVTLHSEDMYIQIYESCISPGLSILYRSCSSRKDYSGNRNHHVSIKDFKENECQETVMRTIQRLINDEQARKAAL